jgi:Mlc titration factor MtfA (ptsG expression regulator)
MRGARIKVAFIDPRIMASLFAPLIIAGVLALVVGWLAGGPLLVAYRRANLRRRPFPEAWREILRRRVPYFRLLPADLQLQLKKHIHVFLAEKPFIGCAGLEVIEEMRVVIAAQACLLLLNRRRPDYFANLRQILIYPGAFIVDRVQTDGAGVLQEQRHVLSGESWSQGQVILSWDDVVDGAAVVDDGRNVVIHEFAHQLDQQNGQANGAPFFVGRAKRARWARVLGDEFARLQDAARDGLPTLLSYYGATNPAEFFAVSSEVFFEQPARMAGEHPELYRELNRFYRVDPMSW